jgi:superfamily II RNA helicase
VLPSHSALFGLQVAAEVQARYSKLQFRDSYTIGVLTSDEREHIDTCQILITEPSCAEMILMAGHHSSLFARIRYVIFDEVHNIVSSNGYIWEHLLTYINSPFVALSATVGNPADFGNWLLKLEMVRD